MREATGCDLENIVYYKDDTHYFVMCAKKQSLLERGKTSSAYKSFENVTHLGVLIHDYDSTQALVDRSNIDRAALEAYARQAADFATEGALPNLAFAHNARGNNDVALFDFTSLYSADFAARIADRNGARLLMSIVGDTLHEVCFGHLRHANIARDIAAILANR